MTNYLAALEQRWAADQAEWRQRVATLERQIAQLTIGTVPVTSTTHPPNPAAGMQIYETDTGLTATWTGTAWSYPPQLVAQAVLTGSQSSVRLPASGSLPQVFTNLRLVISAKSDGTGAAGYDSAFLQFNGITTASYSWNSVFSVQGGAPTNASGLGASSMQCAEIWNAHFGSAGRGLVTIDIPNYSGTSNLKIFSGVSTAIDGGNISIQQWYSGALGASNTAAISSLTVSMGTGNFVSGSVFCLYGS
ncbi:MAG: hypothetical protein YHS30scaffold324_60 [Catenulispora phage 69_17]|jgi:hypothetical protein|nr:MAG: hypothetical protein YHS30scaffold324_60 [Catenulispora phage 69_17]